MSNEEERRKGSLIPSGKPEIEKYSSGLINRGLELVKIIHQEICLYPIILEGKFGYIDKRGKVIIRPQFYEACRFSGGLARVRMSDKWAYIDKAGKVIFSVSLENGSLAVSFEEGMAYFKVADKFGFIAKSGEIISPQFDGTLGFNEGFAPVRVNDKFGYIDKTGKVVIDLKFDFADRFSEGLAAVNIGGKWVKDEDYPEGGRWGYIEKTGKFVVNPQFDWASRFCEGLANVSKQGVEGYVGKTGGIVW